MSQWASLLLSAARHFGAVHGCIMKIKDGTFKMQTLQAKARLTCCLKLHSVTFMRAAGSNRWLQYLSMLSQGGAHLLPQAALMAFDSLASLPGPLAQTFVGPGPG